MASVDLSSISDTFLSYYSDDLTGGGGSSSSSNRTLFGRSGEAIVFLQAYQRLLQTREPQTILVHGEAGVGKTAVVDMLRDPVCDTQGYFVAGKYFQETAISEPYSAITAAFSDLCDLVIQSDEFRKDDSLRKRIADALGSHAQLLVKAITNLSPFLLQKDSTNGEEMEAPSFAQFKSACKTFLHAMASTSHPVVLFLDDVQWADQGSRQLIQLFLQDADLKDVMLILSYRDEEVKKVQNFVLDQARNPTDIALNNLDGPSVCQMVGALLQGKPPNNKAVVELTNLVERRTAGNPLHVTVFMEAIQLDGFVEYDRQSKTCNFDVEKIQQEIMVSEGLADLLTRKIDRLSWDIIETLKVASLLGYHFVESIVLKVASITIEEKQRTNGTVGRFKAGWCHKLALSCLQDATKEGFIEKTSDGYQFTHNKLQSSFRSLIDEDEEDLLNLLAGEAYLTNGGSEKSDIYRAAVHLNCAPGFLHGKQQPAKLARINLDAAKYCEQISAFDKATVALQHGLDILSDVELWSKEHAPLTFEIMEALARAQLIVGDFVSCKETTQEALSHVSTAKRKINLLLIDVEVRMAGNEVDDALLTANRALDALGIKMPVKATLKHISSKLVKVKWMLRNKTDENILNLPYSTDPLMRNAVKLLMHVCTYCLMKDESDTAVYSALLATELTLKYGLSPHSSSAFAIYGVAEVSLGKIDRAYRYGNLALAILEKMDTREAQCPTVGFARSMLKFRKEHLHEQVESLYQVASSGLQYGDIVYGTYCLSQCYNMHVTLGTNLEGLEASMRITYEKVSELGQESLLLWLQPTLQIILNLQSQTCSWENISVLTGEAMSEPEYFHQASQTNNSVLTLVALIFKARLAVFFDQFAVAASIFENCAAIGIDALEFSHGVGIYYWDQARTEYGLFELFGHRSHLRQARKFQKLLHRMELEGCPDASPMLAFLIAQEKSLKKKFMSDAELADVYDQGIRCLAQSSFAHVEGLLNEKAGFDFATRGDYAKSEQYFGRALHIYKHVWGSHAKHARLLEMSRHALKAFRGPIVVDKISGRSIQVSSQGT